MKFSPLVEKALDLQSLIESMEFSTDQSLAAQMAGELRVDLEYEGISPHAKSVGWKCPDSNEKFDKGAWVRYWTDCWEFEKDPDAGRPIIPHRSGG